MERDIMKRYPVTFVTKRFCNVVFICASALIYVMKYSVSSCHLLGGKNPQVG
jgi:hypothetical protein